MNRFTTPRARSIRIPGRDSHTQTLERKGPDPNPGHFLNQVMYLRKRETVLDGQQIVQIAMGTGTLSHLFLPQEKYTGRLPRNWMQSDLFCRS